MPVLSHSGLFSRIFLVKVSLIMGGFAMLYQVSLFSFILFSRDWFSHPSTLSFLEG